MVNWHRLFGLALTDLLTGSPCAVELEKDLSAKRQFLDVVVQRTGSGDFRGQLPDGLDNLGEHNLLTYKSHHEPLDGWAVNELIGHFVNYRKQVAPGPGRLLPEADFRLYAVSTRFPRKLAGQVRLERLQAGAYHVVGGVSTVRLVVPHEVPQVERNAFWHLFSAVGELVRYGAAHYRERTNDTSTIMRQLIDKYRSEGIEMPYTMEDFRRDYAREHVDELLGALSNEQPRQRFSLEELLQRFSREELLQQFSLEEVLRRFSVEQMLQGLSNDEIEAYLAKRQKR